MKEFRYLPDLFGGLTLEAGGGRLRAIRFGEFGVSCGQDADAGSVLLDEAERQLKDYAAGRRFVFELPLEPIGTPFQLAVWSALAAIPYAETRSYRDIARAVDRPKGFQAIGQANTRNPLPIVIPCHRVVNADGSLGGYGGGTERKQELLRLERQYAERYRETAA
jgi:methylated-DNA-[protein]-cysteine S-methyltransferase